jgi:hypothetical protein
MWFFLVGFEKCHSLASQHPQALFHVGTAKAMIALPLAVCFAFVFLVLFIAVGLFDVTVMELNCPLARPLVSGQFFGKSYTPMLAAFTETAHNKLRRIVVRDLGDVIFLLCFRDLRGGFVSFFWV